MRFIEIIRRVVRLYVLAIYMICRSYKRYGYRYDSWLRFEFGRSLYFLVKIAVRTLNRDFIVNRCITVRYNFYPIATLLDMLVAIAYVNEKLGINLKILSASNESYFDNDMLINRTDESGCEPNVSKPYKCMEIAYFGIFFVASEYGHKIISRLSIKENIRKTADEWFDKHIQGNWVAVHYRGTDIEAGKEGIYKSRYRMKLDNYIVYLQSVLENHGSIFVCSDQQQFVDKMHETFPGRVFARDIQRSYDQRALHLNKEYKSIQQQTDALIDILILAKAKLIYATGSGFVDVVRYLNPQIKIVSMDDRRIGRGKNNIPIPKKDLYDKLKR